MEVDNLHHSLLALETNNTLNSIMPISHSQDTNHHNSQALVSQLMDSQLMDSQLTDSQLMASQVQDMASLVMASPWLQLQAHHQCSSSNNNK